MSKTISFRGKLDEGLEEQLHLKTNNGKTGYKITKFQIMSSAPGSDNYETTVKIYTKPQGSGTTGVDFTEGDLLAAAHVEDSGSYNYPTTEVIIFDNAAFNQDIVVSTASLVGTIPINFYIEIETIALTDVQATQLTLKNLRTITSR